MVLTPEKGLRSTILGILANAILAVIKGIAGVLGNSYALIADAIESTTDIASSLIVWGGLKISGIPPDIDHPYGHGKAEPLAATVVALFLFAVAIGIAIQSSREILVPHHAPAPFTLIVLVAVVITKESLFRFVFNVGKSIDSTAVKSDAWHHRSDAITSAAAATGISIALIGGPGYESADDWAALFASGIIAFNAFRILRPAINEVMDAAPTSEIEQAVRETARRVEGVIGLEKCRIRKMGLAYYVDLHVTVDGHIAVHEGHEIAREVKARILAAHANIADVLIHIEPSDLLEE
jgi:cation diffusion facilitator family transporter